MNKDICGFDSNYLKQIKTLMEETNIEELEIKEGENRYLKISKKKADAPFSGSYFPQPSNIQAIPSASEQAQDENRINAVSQAAAQKVNAYDDEKKYYKIKSPVIGTFYSAPSPDSPPFVKAGDTVSADSTVCIVEAMKVMNEIKAEVQGKIIEILKMNGNAVQSNEVMFIMQKA